VAGFGCRLARRRRLARRGRFGSYTLTLRTFSLVAFSLRRVGEEFFQLFAGLKVRDTLGRHINRLAGLRIAATAWAALAGAEAAEAAQFDLFAFVQRPDNRIKNRFDNHFRVA